VPREGEKQGLTSASKGSHVHDENFSKAKDVGQRKKVLINIGPMIEWKKKK